MSNKPDNWAGTKSFCFAQKCPFPSREAETFYSNDFGLTKPEIQSMTTHDEHASCLILYFENNDQTYNVKKATLDISFMKPNLSFIKTIKYTFDMWS